MEVNTKVDVVKMMNEVFYLTFFLLFLRIFLSAFLSPTGRVTIDVNALGEGFFELICLSILFILGIIKLFYLGLKDATSNEERIFWFICVSSILFIIFFGSQFLKILFLEA